MHGGGRTTWPVKGVRVIVSYTIYIFGILRFSSPLTCEGKAGKHHTEKSVKRNIGVLPLAIFLMYSFIL